MGNLSCTYRIIGVILHGSSALDFLHAFNDESHSGSNMFLANNRNPRRQIERELSRNSLPTRANLQELGWAEATLSHALDHVIPKIYVE